MARGRLGARVMDLKEPAVELSELLRAVTGGDAGALEELYRHLESPIYAFAMSRLGDPEQAAEALHEVMLEVWRRAGAFQGRSHPRTWVLGIARHKIFDIQRRSRRWRPEPPPGEDLADPAATTPFHRLQRRERGYTVRQALDGLSEDHREVIHLAFYQELSYPQISRLLEIPEGTVKSRVFHAKEALRRRLRGPLEGSVS